MAAHIKRIELFEELLSPDNIDRKELCQLCMSGCPEGNGIRSLVWKILLYYLPLKKADWKSTLSKQRGTYKSFVEELIIKPGLQDDSGGDHPLNPNPDSQWRVYFKDNEALLQIDKDCRRLHPDLEFFQLPTKYPCERLTQSSNGLETLRKRVEQSVLESRSVNADQLGKLSRTEGCRLSKAKSSPEYKTLSAGQEAHWEVVQRMLFIFYKLNHGVKYVQGMNELLAPIYYTFATDPSADWSIHAEADAFFCFTHLMGEIGDNFISSLDNAIAAQGGAGIQSNMHRVMKYVEYIDGQVFRRLESQSLKVEFFVFRWFTLLLSQEFNLPDVIRLWDSLFADEFRFSLLHNVCCALITNVKEQILKNDFASNMKLLQNYPPVDLEVIIKNALKIQKITAVKCKT